MVVVDWLLHPSEILLVETTRRSCDQETNGEASERTAQQTHATDLLERMERLTRTDRCRRSTLSLLLFGSSLVGCHSPRSFLRSHTSLEGTPPLLSLHPLFSILVTFLVFYFRDLF